MTDRQADIFAGSADPQHIRCGDVVRHIPTNEKWTVAYADYATGYLGWSGWPEGRARISNCVLVRRATDAQHRDHVADWLNTKGADHRRSAVERLYGSLPAPGGEED